MGHGNHILVFAMKACVFSGLICNPLLSETSLFMIEHTGTDKTNCFPEYLLLPNQYMDKIENSTCFRLFPHFFHWVKTSSHNVRLNFFSFFTSLVG